MEYQRRAYGRFTHRTPSLRARGGSDVRAQGWWVELLRLSVRGWDRPRLIYAAIAAVASVVPWLLDALGAWPALAGLAPDVVVGCVRVVFPWALVSALVLARRAYGLCVPSLAYAWPPTVVWCSVTGWWLWVQLATRGVSSPGAFRSLAALMVGAGLDFVVVVSFLVSRALPLIAVLLVLRWWAPDRPPLSR